MIPASTWTPAGSLTLEPNALLAAKEPQRCLAMTAGPGAGKSEMLAQRADFLLRTGLCRYPRRILAISFKVDAAKNLKDRVRRRCGMELASRFDSFTFHAFAKRIVDRFRPLLTGKDALVAGYKIGTQRLTSEQIEFKDLVPLALQILNSSDQAKHAIRQTYTDVFLDEFQDCTDAQYELVKAAFLGTGIRLTAVGDTKQRIMGWAGAMDGIFPRFAHDFDAIPLNLYRNFRSQPVLLRMQNEVIGDLDAASAMADDQIKGEGGEVFALEYETAQEEGEGMVGQIAKWHGQGIPYSEIAVLLPRQVELYGAQLIAALTAAGIPFRNEQQLQDASAEPAARLIVDFLASLYGEREPKAWVRMMEQLAPFEEGDEGQTVRQELQRFVKKQRKDLMMEELIDGQYSSWKKAVVAFLKFVGGETLMALSPDYEASARLNEVIKDTGKHISRMLKEEPDLLKALRLFSDDQSVRILTVHKSKGLEFDTVILPALETDTWWTREPKEQLCVYFVGISRAKSRLVLSCAKQRDRPEGHTGRWLVDRTPQEDYFRYAYPFVSGN